jgi:uncharacterized protein YbgA (DUF1722 family)/uncharacterized protein YbbK (DUF523 family)
MRENMVRFATPVVVVSKCLGFAECRYNGDMINDPLTAKLAEFVRYIPVCPEVEIGLGTPRETLRMVAEGEDRRLVQPSTGKDVTEDMKKFSAYFLQSLDGVDGFILKSRSPSCGIKDVKIYAGREKAPVIEKGSGLFAQEVVSRFPNAAIEEEGRLTNFRIREHFLTKLFTLSLFREMKKEPSMQKLVEFHTQHKYLFMAYHQQKLKELGNIVANRERLSMEEVFSAYEAVLQQLFTRTARRGSNINVCQHLMGYFKNELSPKEKDYFKEILEKYRHQKLPLSSVTSVLKSWAVRYENEYLLNQCYFEPYPEELVEITDSGKGRDY